MRGPGEKGRAGGSGGGECWSDSGFILKAESIGFPDGLEEKCERERRQGTSKVSAGRRGFRLLRGEALRREVLGREGRSGIGFGTW